MLLALSILYLCYIPAQSDFYQILSGFTLAFVAYFFCIFFKKRGADHLGMAIAVGIIIRLALVPAFPNLSDDIYRFLWDGHLIHQGISPLSALPSELVLHSEQGSYLHNLFPWLNSPNYYTVYPPISQLVYYMATINEGWSWSMSAVIIKLILLLAELGTLFFSIKLLALLKLPRHWSLAYFLNPLVIVELMGQVHFEGVMVCFLAGALYFLASSRYFASGALLGLSVGAKLLPLMFVPAIIGYLGRKNSWSFLTGLGAVTAVLFVPYFWEVDVEHFLASISLYSKSFEFNSSAYFLLRTLGYWLTGYNQIGVIGPFLQLVTLATILWLSFSKVIKDIPSLLRICFYAFAMYLCCATTVHPWYLIMLLFFSIFVRQSWVWVWSGVVILSYATYKTTDYDQNLLLVSIEYLIVLAALVYGLKKGLFKRDAFV